MLCSVVREREREGEHGHGNSEKVRVREREEREKGREKGREHVRGRERRTSNKRGSVREKLNGQKKNPEGTLGMVWMHNKVQNFFPFFKEILLIFVRNFYSKIPLKEFIYLNRLASLFLFQTKFAFLFTKSANV